MNVAILLLIWRRPGHTKKVIDSIRKIAPRKIYISADGHKKNDDYNKKLVEMVREIVIKEIDWECKVMKNFSKVNKGCKNAVSDGIDWFFNYENEGIILEDDCLPSEAFYYFCSSLLEKYRNNEKIWAICGNGYQESNMDNENSYFYSRYVDIWGWATWKRCWQKYDRDMKTWQDKKSAQKLKNIFEKNREFKYWKKIFDNLFFNNQPDTWDYQWQYTLFINSGMACMPFMNLVENIGFGEGATHTTEIPVITDFDIEKSKSFKFPLCHPNYISRSKKCDKNLQELFYSGYPIFSFKGLFLKFKRIYYKSKKIFLLLKNLLIN